MRRTTITLSAVLMLLAFAPASALARHHRRHHSHARIERFGRDVASAPTSSNSADNAGTVQSFSNGVLTVMLGDGSTVSGAVTKDTELECMAPEQSQTIHEDGDGGSGDQSGSDGQSGSGDQSAGGETQAQGSEDQSAGEDQGDAAEQNGNQAEDQNENDAAGENENDAQNNCSTADLTRGAVVREAELRISSAGSTWKKVELGS